MGPQASPFKQVFITSQTSYEELQSSPGNHQYVFCYKIKIENKGPHTVQLLARHWVIKDALERIEEVKGTGVVGKQPKIKPGESFEYESYCPLTTKSGSMRGWYEFTTEAGDRSLVEIPEFYFFDPYCLH